MFLNSSKTAYFTIYRYCAGFVSDIPTVVPLVVWRAELWWYASVTFWSDLSSRPNFLCVSNSSMGLFQNHSLFSALVILFSFIFMDNKLPDIFVVLELCVIVHLRALGRKFDAGRCVTRGAVCTLPRRESSADALLPSTRPGLLPQRGRPFIIPLLFMCFMILQNWNCWYNNFELPKMWTLFN